MAKIVIVLGNKNEIAQIRFENEMKIIKSRAKKNNARKKKHTA